MAHWLLDGGAGGKLPGLFARKPSACEGASRRLTLLWKTWRGFHFRDLLVVAQIVEWDVDQPLVGVQCAEDRERMIARVFFQRHVGFFGKLDLAGARVLITLDHFLLAHFAVRLNRLRRLRFVRAIHHYSFHEFRLAVRL